MSTMRRRARRNVKRATSELFVVGSTGDGFSLAANVGVNLVKFGKVHKRQKDAKQQGERSFGKLAKALRDKG